jgi:hypothetical protein
MQMPELFAAIQSAALAQQPPAPGQEASALRTALRDHHSAIAATSLPTSATSRSNTYTKKFRDSSECANIAEEEKKNDTDSKETNLGKTLLVQPTSWSMYSPAPVPDATASSAVVTAATKSSSESSWDARRTKSRVEVQMARIASSKSRRLIPLPTQNAVGVNICARLNAIRTTGEKGTLESTIMGRTARWRVDDLLTTVEQPQMKVNFLQPPTVTQKGPGSLGQQ